MIKFIARYFGPIFRVYFLIINKSYRWKYFGNKAVEKNPKKAKKYGEELLKLSETQKGTWDYGNTIHHGNLILGRAALKEGNIEDAKKFLLKAGMTPGSPQLNSFGPNMTLAKELLEKGEKKIVLDYFDLCMKFWSSKYSKQYIDGWKSSISQDQILNFGPHLKY